MGTIAWRCGGVFVATVLTLVARPAYGQEAAPPELAPLPTPMVENGAELDVSRRHRPAFDPVGIPLAGNWRLYPSVASRLGFETNIYGSETDRDSGGFAQIEPSLVANTTFPSGDATIEASGRFQRYFSQSEADQTSYRVAASGGFDVSGTFRLEGGGNVARLVEPRDSTGFPSGRVEPVHYQQDMVFLHGTYQSGVVRALATVDYTRFNFDDTKVLSADSQPIATLDQDGRDQHILRGSLAGEIAVSSGLSIFAQGISSSIHFREAEISPGMPNLSGMKNTALVGIELGTSQLLRGSIGVGYVWYDYDASSLRTIGGVAVNADIHYFVTPLLTLSAKASRTVEQAVLEQQSGGYISTTVSVRADYELLRALILNFGSQYSRSVFDLQPRRDRVFGIFGGGTYHLGRRISLELNMGFDRRRISGDPTAPDYDDFTATSGVRFSL